MTKKRVRSYYEIEEEEGNEAAHKLCREDGEWVDKNFPQLTRIIQVVNYRIDTAEFLMENIKDSISKINQTLQIISSFTGDSRNEIKH